MSDNSLKSSFVKARLLAADLRVAMRRRHRKCSRCKHIRILCTLCARMWCPSCLTACPRTHHQIITPTLSPTAKPAVSSVVSNRLSETDQYLKDHMPNVFDQIRSHGWKLLDVTVSPPEYPAAKYLLLMRAKPRIETAPWVKADATFAGYSICVFETDVIKESGQRFKMGLK